MRATLSEQYEEIERLYRELRGELDQATRRQAFTIAERNIMARRLDRLRAARELIWRLMQESGEGSRLLPADDDLYGVLQLVQRTIAGPDELSTAFRECIVKVDGGVTLGQVVDAAIASYQPTEKRAA